MAKVSDAIVPLQFDVAEFFDHIRKDGPHQQKVREWMEGMDREALHIEFARALLLLDRFSHLIVYDAS